MHPSPNHDGLPVIPLVCWTGKGTQIWKSTGAIYSGDWKFGKRDGYGSYSILDPVTKEYKKVYTGWWENDRRGVSEIFCQKHGQELCARVQKDCLKY